MGLGDTLRRGDDNNEMGDNLPFIKLGSGQTALAVASGYFHTCAMLHNRSLKCWGSNGYGQLGLEDFRSKGDEPNEMGDGLPSIDLGTDRYPVLVVSGSYHLCALLDNHAVKCWGDNDFSQLGLGDVEWRGDEPGEMGDNLPVVSIDSKRQVVSLFAGREKTCAALDDKSIKCWGQNELGSLGLGDIEDRGDEPDEMGDALPNLDFGQKRYAVSLGLHDTGTCAVLDNGAVKCWGRNSHGQLGLGDQEDRGDDPNEMGDNLPEVSLGVGRKAKSIAVGNGFACALFVDGAVKCWGWGTIGELGLGENYLTIGRFIEQMGDNLPFVDL